jgi:hypothetical protein
MPNLPELWWPLLPFFASLSLILGMTMAFLSLAYFHLNRRLNAVQKSLDERSAPSIFVGDDLATSQKASQEILQKAQHRAQEIIMNAEFFTSMSDKDMQHMLDTVSHRQVEEFTRALDDLRHDLDGAMKDVGGSMQREMVEELAHFRGVLEKHAQAAEETLAAQLHAHQAALQQTTERYQEDLETKLSKNLEGVMDQVITQFIHRKLTPTEQAELVRDALTEAKKSALFS